MTLQTTDGRNLGPEVYDDVEAVLVSGEQTRFSRLYLFERASFLQLYRFGEIWPHLLPWPAPGKHRRIVGYLERDVAGTAFGLRTELLKITARRSDVLKEINDIRIVETQQDSAGRLKVKFRARQSSLVFLKGDAVEDEDRRDT